MKTRLIALTATVIIITATPFASALTVTEDFESPAISVGFRDSYTYAPGRVAGTTLIDIWRLSGDNAGLNKLPDGAGTWDLTVLTDHFMESPTDDGRTIGSIGYFKNIILTGQTGYLNIQGLMEYRIDSTPNFGIGSVAANTDYTVTLSTATNVTDAEANVKNMKLGLVAGTTLLGTFDEVAYMTANTKYDMSYSVTAGQIDASLIGQPLSIRIIGDVDGPDASEVGFIGQTVYDNIVFNSFASTETNPNAVPTPAALPVGLVMLGLIVTCRRK